MQWFLCLLIKAQFLFIEGKVSPARSLVAGLGAGITEAIFAVTPSETIKYVTIQCCLLHDDSPY